MPPDVRDWLPEDHLAWFVMDAVAGMNLKAFYDAYRRDGVGRRAYDPAMVVALLLYCYSRGTRSARAIERACSEDVACRVIAMLETPDHATLARFVDRHQAALGDLFGQVLGLCDQAGLVKAGMVAVDGTRLAGNTSRSSNRDFSELAREILAEAQATDEAEDALYGQARGDELPEQLRTREGRREFFARAREQRDLDAGQTEPTDQAAQADTVEMAGEPLAFDAEQILARGQGRSGWVRDARRQHEQRRWQTSQPVPRSRHDRLVIAAGRMEDDLDAQREGNAAYEQFRAVGRDTATGGRLGGRPKPWIAPEHPDLMVSVTDPDSRHIKAPQGFVQGYNAQAVVDENQIVLAAEITNSTADFSQLAPMITAALAELDAVGCDERPRLAVADAQYWNEQHIDQIVADEHIQVLIPPDSGMRRGPRPGWTGGRYAAMRTSLSSPAGKELYGRREQMIEPVFAHTKHNRRITRFTRRGRTAVRTEWRLLMATHNLTKLHRHHLTALPA